MYEALSYYLCKRDNAARIREVDEGITEVALIAEVNGYVEKIVGAWHDGATLV